MTNTKVNVKTVSPTMITNGTQYALVDGGAGATSIAPTAAVRSSSGTVSYVASVGHLGGGGGNDDIILTAHRAGFQSVARGLNAFGVGRSLEGFNGGAGGSAGSGGGFHVAAAGAHDLSLLQGGLDSALSEGAVNVGLTSLTPGNTGVGAASQDTQYAALDTIDGRMNASRAGQVGETAGASGIATGDADDTPYLKGIWMKGFGTFQDQDSKDGVAGYNANTGGVTVGADTAKLLNHTLVGAAATYANTKVNGKGGSQADTSINSYEAGLYAQRQMDPQGANYYVKGQLSAAYNDYKESRAIALLGSQHLVTTTAIRGPRGWP